MAKSNRAAAAAALQSHQPSPSKLSEPSPGKAEPQDYHDVSLATSTTKLKYWEGEAVIITVLINSTLVILVSFIHKIHSINVLC